MTSPTRNYAGPQVAVVVSGWPRVSEVFAQNELVALERAGMLAAVFATKGGEPGARQPGVDQLSTRVRLLPDDDVAGQAFALAHQLAGRGVTALHGYFAHRPTAVAAAAAGLLGIPYGFSVHALDARRVTRDEMAGQATKAAVVICCNADAAAEVEAAGHHPELLRHGVDLTRFAAVPAPGTGPLTLLAVGRLVEKKGFDVLLEALALLEPSVRLRIVGDGPLRAELAGQVVALGLADRVELLGSRTHADLPALYAGADVVVVPSVVDRHGDRDGLPNVVLEAMASGRPVVASDVAAIPAAVRDGVTGTLVPPRDPVHLAAALAALGNLPSRRAAMGRAGRDLAEREFALDTCTAAFCRTLEKAYV